MKKISKNMLLIVVGILVAFTIDVAAEAVISSGAVSYSNSATSETTVSGALDELFSAVDINTKIGTTDISAIGDGTITGAINKLNNDFSNSQLVVEALVVGEYLTTTASNYSTLDGRKFSDYSVIIFTAGVSPIDYRLQLAIPYVIFGDPQYNVAYPNSVYYLQGPSGSSGEIYNQVVFKYNNDTSITAYLTAGVLNYVRVWGIKNNQDKDTKN